MSTAGVRKVIAIGGSAGSLDPLKAILAPLPAPYPFPILVTLHIPQERPSGICGFLNACCGIPAREAEDKDELQPGQLYCAPPNYHLLIERSGSIALSVDPPVNYSRPSIDVLFMSVSESIGSRAVGILLSGANEDGGQGLAAIRAAGGSAIAQHPQSAASPAMPEAALKLDPGICALAPEEIASFLLSLAHDMT